MKKHRELFGLSRIRLTSADPGGALQRIINQNQIVTDVHYIDAFTIECNIYTKGYFSTTKALKKHGDRVELVYTNGLQSLIRKMTHRIFLVVAVTILLFLTIFLPTRILFIDVQGNTLIPQKLILEKAEECGILFGASRKAVRSEKVKNELIASIPELQWVGINTTGCVATIQVEEKSLPENEPSSNEVSCIIADRDGIIQSCTVEQGNLLCSIGQAVKKGQILVSGYIDSGLVIKATDAKAEIYALTQRELTIHTPIEYKKRTVLLDQRTNYSIRIGKKLINFCKDSGIWDASCVRMYEEEYITLPGGYSLPISIIKESVEFYEIKSDAKTAEDVLPLLQNSATHYLLSQTIAGQICSSQYSVTTNDAVYTGNGQFSCLEMIGRNITEEHALIYGKEH